jgi:hypothetical protein
MAKEIFIRADYFSKVTFGFRLCSFGSKIAGQASMFSPNKDQHVERVTVFSLITYKGISTHPK